MHLSQSQHRLRVLCRARVAGGHRDEIGSTVLAVHALVDIRVKP
jgi:hypothetical protein